MSGPIETAYQALAAGLAARLVTAGFLSDPTLLAVDPASPIEPDGEPAKWASAALMNYGTSPVRTLMGSGAARFVVERQARLELGASAADQAELEAMLAAALEQVAGLPIADPTLSGAAERLALNSAEVDDLPPSGRKVFLAFVVRVRSGDPLGMTP